MEHLYRDHRIALKCAERWTARITHVSGTIIPLSAFATLEEGADACAERARAQIDRYTAYLGRPDPESGGH